MRVLILGVAGMAGHKLWQVLGDEFEAYGTLHGDPTAYEHTGLFDRAGVLSHVDAEDLQALVRVFAQIRPEAVINAVGIVKQRAEAKQALPSLAINAVLPHRLAMLCAACGARLIHLSTDCVFTGARGGYTEDDVSDAQDLYGRTKLLGEVDYCPGLTLRTSIIGRELANHRGLVDWFLSQRGKQVRGFTKAIFSGLTTLELSRLIAKLLREFPDLSGLYQVSTDPISKYDLLCLIREVYGLDISIEPDVGFSCDRSLSSVRFRHATGYAPPPWPELITQMRDDPTPYPDGRS